MRVTAEMLKAAGWWRFSAIRNVAGVLYQHISGTVATFHEAAEIYKQQMKEKK